MKPARRFRLIATLLLLGVGPNVVASDEAGEATADARGLIEFFDQRKASAPNRPGPNCVLYGDVSWSESLTNRPRDIRNKRCRNDRIQHVRLQGPIAAGTRIQVFNNGGASTTTPGDSSWGEILIRSDLLTGQEMIIGSFEPFQSNAAMVVQSACNMRSDGQRWCPFGNDNYLDEKISYVRVIPARAERTIGIPSIDEAVKENIVEQPVHSRD